MRNLFLGFIFPPIWNRYVLYTKTSPLSGNDRKQITFSFTVLSNGKRTNQIKNFMLKLNELTNDFKIDKQPADWLEAFSYLKIFLN